MPSRFAAVTNKEISQLIKRAVHEIHEEGDGWEFKQVKLCLFDLNLSIYRALIGYSISGYPALFTDSSPVPPSERRQIRVCLPGLLP